MTDNVPMGTPDNPVLFIPTGENSGQVIPAQAIASWGELLGVDDETALAAIVSGSTPDPSLDVPGGNGWTGLYDSAAEALRTKEVIKRATAEPVTNMGENQPHAKTLALLGKFGVDVVMGQAEALRIDRQLKMKPRNIKPLTREAKVMLDGVKAQVEKNRSKFRDDIIPAETAK